ncbi:unnamed protein product [Cladocopium goreaui]|uniref:EF-hand domain-containing protein n=1 Tax=Cladocopium goreaui TaxID=2562237 RepID=A0A9P1D5L4_9DINO|nr:unnamed protein product [Cladocopium goreaui]
MRKLLDKVDPEAEMKDGGSLPVGRQPESEPGLSQAGDQPAPGRCHSSSLEWQQLLLLLLTFGPSSSRSNETGGSKETGSLPFQKGERLQVWSNSKNSWRNGEVLEAFPVACKAEGFAVPAGTLKVSFDAGTIKWVMPGQATAILRKAPS